MRIKKIMYAAVMLIVVSIDIYKVKDSWRAKEYLKGTKTEGGVVVINENLNGEDEYIAQVKVTQARSYLEKSKTAREVLACASKYHMMVVVDNNDEDTFSKREGENQEHINWDPESATEDIYLKSVSPALSLAHEMQHECNYETNQPEMMTLIKEKNIQYTNNEEKRVMVGTEAKIAKELGEDIRKSHKGTSYEVTSVSSRKGIATPEGYYATVLIEEPE